MKKSFQFRSQLTAGGEILAQHATFLPVEAARAAETMGVRAPEMRDLGVFLPDFNLKRKKMTVAQPLLKEV